MSATLLLVLIVGLAYLATHLAFDWLARRFHLISGAEYLVLGILLGPQVSGLLSTEVLDSFAPLITLAVAWIGAGVGLRLIVPTLVTIPGLHYRLAFGQALATFAVVTVVELYALRWLFDLPFDTAMVPALALAAIAVSSTPFAVDVVARSLKRDAPILRLLDTAALVDAFVAILAIGILLCIERPFLAGHGRAFTPTEWFAITLAIGVIGGALFHLFLGGEQHPDRLFVALAGSLVLATGAAAYLGLSPLLVAMVVGAMLVNTSRRRDHIERVITQGQRPFYFVMLIFAGASWHPGAPSWLPVILFLCVRTAGKIGGARLSARLARAIPVVGRGWGWALFGQGGIALAIALDYLRHDAALFPDLVFTTAVVSVLLTDALSARFARAVIAPVIDEADPDQLRVSAEAKPALEHA